MGVTEDLVGVSTWMSGITHPMVGGATEITTPSTVMGGTGALMGGAGLDR